MADEIVETETQEQRSVRAREIMARLRQCTLMRAAR